MNTFNLNRSQVPLSRNEWVSFIRVYRHFLQQQTAGIFPTKSNFSKLLREVLGIGKHTAEATIDFSNREQLLIESKQLGRPKKEVESDYAQVMHDSINLSNKTGQADTTKLTYAQIPAQKKL